MLKQSMILAAVVAAAPLSAQTTVFSENFSGGTPGTYGNTSIPGTAFKASGANVDIVGVLNGSFFSCVANPSGNCVDMVGDSGAGSFLTSTPIGVVAGNTYTIGFTDILQGFSAGDTTTSTFSVSLESLVTTITSTAVVTNRTLTFIAATTDPTAALQFHVLTAPDGVHGPVVSNITVTSTAPVTAVPEPASWALMIVGFGLIGTAMRHRTRVVFG